MDTEGPGAEAAGLREATKPGEAKVTQLKFDARTKWESDAREAGREFAKQNPAATGVQIDEAAYKFCPVYPSIRWFRESAIWEIREPQE